MFPRLTDLVVDNLSFRGQHNVDVYLIDGVFDKIQLKMTIIK